MLTSFWSIQSIIGILISFCKAVMDIVNTFSKNQGINKCKWIVFDFWSMMSIFLISVEYFPLEIYYIYDFYQ